ncbi:hypothetical protein EDI28_21580 [Photobacterium chitinilyticum]|uniref:Uncharacterized protein n=2 Tax=Photobacterium chitinilyticum TaxID=2485123 RepID=A0A3S3UGM4_9GAMM|nr:hypothetical protein EDI28_21580 [Photobacterium chitinilyticum]
MSPQGFSSTETAGKAGTLLSALSASHEESKLPFDRVDVLARASNINRLEIKPLLEILRSRDLVDFSSKEVAVLGVTSTTALQHTSDIFDVEEPSGLEQASLELAELASEKPYEKEEIIEILGDEHHLDGDDKKQLFKSAEDIGFVEVEHVDSKYTLLFNGNLFKKDETAKINKILESLSSAEQSKLIEVNCMLDKNACIEQEVVENILGRALFSKVMSVGVYDLNVVSNEKEDSGYITKPSAFSKYSTSNVEDAFDLVKAFVSSLTYGMTKSSHARGQITMVEKLLQKLVDGKYVGPAHAIASDYKILEYKNVVKIDERWNDTFYGRRYGYCMRLLKTEVGELALQAIRNCDVSAESLENFPSASITKYLSPEINRTTIRKKQIRDNKKSTNDMLMILRQ